MKERAASYTQWEIESIISRLQSVPGIRTLEFKSGCGFPHILVIKSSVSFFFWLVPKGYQAEVGEFDYRFWFPENKVFVVHTANDVLEKLKIQIPPGIMQEFKKNSTFRVIRP